MNDGELPSGWRWASVGEIFDVFVGSTPKRNNLDYWDGEINWVSSSEVNFRRIKTTRERITIAGLRESACKLHPPGTVILAMIGEGKTRGQVALLEVESTHNQNTAAIRPNPDLVLPEHLFYFLWANYEKSRMIGSGNNQKALSKERVQTIRFPLPPTLDEQARVVAEIEARLSVCDKVEESISQSLAQAEALRQSILKKAFEGKLVPQDANDEPASELLARIRAAAESPVGAERVGKDTAKASSARKKAKVKRDGK